MNTLVQYNLLLGNSMLIFIAKTKSTLNTKNYGVAIAERIEGI